MAIRTFGRQLRHFAKSTDILHKDDFNELRRMCWEYLKQSFSMDKVELLLETKVGQRPHLVPQWDRTDRYGAYPVEDPKRPGEPNGLNALAFISGDPLWITGVGSQEATLSEENTAYQDLWSDIQDLPRFRRFEEEHRPLRPKHTRTLVSIPLRTAGTAGPVYGVLYFESSKALPANKRAKQELEWLAEALSILYQLAEQSERRNNNTREAIGELGDILSDTRIDFRVAKPKLFFAYPDPENGGDSQVIAIIRQVLDEFAEDVELIDWKELAEPGNIHQQILKHVQSSEYAICLLSEIAEKGEDGVTYRDNENVLFEAGMIHALVQDAGAVPRGWIPVREEPPPNIPFDFSPIRILVVDRLPKTRKLNEDAFRTDLRARLQALLL